jgi:thiol-disulfide isomerase/thioredoxin
MLRFFLAFVCLLGSIQGASTPRPLADVTVPMPDGKKIHLGQYRGKVMLVVLVSTTCDHCLSSLGMLSNLQKEYGPKGFQAVGIAADDEAQKNLPGFIRLQISLPVGYLDQNTTMQVFDFKPTDHPFVPMFMFVDKKGTVRFQYAGKDDFFKAEEKNTRLLIEALLKQ